MADLKALHDELAELTQALKRLWDACPDLSGTEARPRRELVEQLVQRDAQARRHLPAATYAALSSRFPVPNASITCMEFRGRAVDLWEAVRAYKHERAPRDAAKG